MSVLSHYNRSKVRKRLLSSVRRTKITKGSVMSLMLVLYNLFLRSLLKAANSEARNLRSKITRGQHVVAVARKVLLKYKR